MATINSFEDLKVWQKSRQLCQLVFEYLRFEKFSKDYALRDQINRLSGSVMDNIAEGFGRQSANEFINHLTFANGSLLEVKSQLYRALDRGYISSAQFTIAIELTNEVGKMITSFIPYLNKSDIRGCKFKDRNTRTDQSATKNEKL